MCIQPSDQSGLNLLNALAHIIIYLPMYAIKLGHTRFSFFQTFGFSKNSLMRREIYSDFTIMALEGKKAGSSRIIKAPERSKLHLGHRYTYRRRDNKGTNIRVIKSTK